MNRIYGLTLVFAMCLASASLAVELQQDSGYPGSFDRFAAPPSPGLRFSGTAFSVRTAATDGGYGAGYGYGYGTGACGCNGQWGCYDFSQMPWFATWDRPYSGGGHGRQRACCPNGNY